MAALKNKDREIQDIQENMVGWKKDTLTKLAEKFEVELNKELDKYDNLINFFVVFILVISKNLVLILQKIKGTLSEPRLGTGDLRFRVFYFNL